MNLPSSFSPVRPPAKNGTSPGLPPTGVDFEFIQNLAAAPAEDVFNEAAAGEVEAFHRSLFLGHHAGELERRQQESRIHADRVERLEGRLNGVNQRVAGLDKLLAPLGEEAGTAEKPAPTPWTMWDRVMFALAGLGVAGLLVFGVLNISFNLLESGLITFQENPIRAYFWAALLPVGAMAVKVGWDLIEGRAARRAYLWICLSLGMAGVLAWVAAYAAVYPSLSKNTSERIQSLSVFDAGGSPGGLAGVNFAGTKWLDVIIVAAQAVSEIFISATLGIYMTLVAGRHGQARLASNPLFTQLEEERVSLERELAAERRALGDVRGHLSRLEHELAALIALARSTYRKEAELRRDQNHRKRELLDQIADQLRTQFQTAAEGVRPRREQLAPPASVGGPNGR